MKRAPLALALAATCLSCLQPVRVARAPARGEATLSVVSWNVNYGLGGDLESVQVLEEVTRGADLVLLQETNSAWEAAAAARLRARFPYQRWLDDEAAGGQAVLSRRPFVVRETIAAPTGWFPALRLEVATALGPVQVLNVHLHPPVSASGSVVSGYLSTGPVRRWELATFAQSLAPGLPTLIVGDFNEGTSGDAVEWSEREGYRSALPEFAPAATTWHWPVSKGLELRAQLDHVLYGPGLEPLEAKVLRAGRSDHDPVVVTFTAAPRRLEVDLPKPRGASLGITSRGSR